MRTGGEGACIGPDGFIPGRGLCAVLEPGGAPGISDSGTDCVGFVVGLIACCSGPSVSTGRSEAGEELSRFSSDLELRAYIISAEVFGPKHGRALFVTATDNAIAAESFLG